MLRVNVMTKTLTTYEFNLPAHWAPLLINWDFTSLDIDEEHQLDEFIDANFPEGFCTVTVESDETFFSKYHDAKPFGVLACDCLTYTFTN
jgi:hypothetical protein